MDERKKSILAVEGRRDIELSKIDNLLSALGRLLLERSSDGRIAQERDAYNKISAEIARLDMEIRLVDEKSARIAELGVEISSLERANAESSRRLSLLYNEVGAFVLNNADFSAFNAAYSTQLNAILQEIDVNKQKIDSLEQNNPANVLSLIGGGFRKMGAKAALVRAEGALKKIYAQAGADWARSTDAQSGENIGNGAASPLLSETLSLAHEAEERAAKIDALKNEKRTLQDSFGQKGNADKARSEFSRGKENAQESLNDLFLRLGKKAYEPSTCMALQSLLDDEMSAVLNNAKNSRVLVRDYEEQIAKLRSSLEIDEERAEIDKLEKAIAAQRRRISESEETIAAHERGIDEAKKRIAAIMNT